MGLTDWFKERIAPGKVRFEGEMSNGSTCSVDLQDQDKNTKKFVNARGGASCVAALKRLVNKVER